MVGRKKGTHKTGGRQKGTLNRTTKEAQEFLQKILYGQFDNIQVALETLNKDDKAKYIDSLNKLMQYVLPKKTDVTTGDEPIRQSLNVTVDSNKTADTLQKLRDGSNTD